ncbi:MAG: ATP-dependent helicase [Lachnospiraceae bacterium]|nr:ATP-dependent helicase [Lachnospiraceae bacterium]
MKEKEFLKKYAAGFTEQQIAAVRASEGPVLLLAVPGSGKTTVLVTRLGWLVYVRKIPPERILTVTYTTAATRDMKRRFAGLFGGDAADRLEFRTINGICARIIHYSGRQKGRRPFALLENEGQINALLSEIYQEVMQDYPMESDLKSIRTQITYIKNQMLKEEEIRALDAEAEYRISEIFLAYKDRLRQQGLMDYDDQMVYARNILRTDPEILSYFREQYPYICVDEAQDTSRIQHAIISLLAGPKANLFMVGDEDQSIYGFRAACPDALLRFEKDHPGARVLLMEQNFRSDANIVSMADRFAAGNLLRHEKHMKAVRGAVFSVRKVMLKSRKGQYRYLLKAAADCRETTAVLYRDNESVLPLVDLLEKEGVPYRIRSGDLSFFSNRVVRDISDILRFSLHPEDEELFLRIYYKLSLYLSKENARRAAELAKRLGVPLLDAALANGNLADGTAKSIKNIRAHLQKLRTDAGDAAIRRVCDLMGYRDYLKRSGIGENKLYILQVLGEGTKNPEEYLEHLSRLSALIREKEDDPECKWILSTIHGSKGLEYDSVYLMDVTDGIFPDKLPGSLDRPRKGEAASEAWKDYEEERRLFYVGVTRAKNHLTVFRLPGDSDFADEFFRMPGNQRQAPPYRPSGNQNRGYGGGALSSFDEEGYRRFKDGLAKGMIVTHRYLGRGILTELKGDTAAFYSSETDETKQLSLRIIYMQGLFEE